MSNAIQTATLLEAIRVAILAAWTGITSVDYEQPRAGQRALPYAVAKWENVPISFQGLGATVRQPGQDNTFTIVGRFPFPADLTLIPLAKIARANELIARLQSGPSFAGTGFMPLVTNVSPDESEDNDEGAYEITLTFNVLTTADHH